MVEVRGQRTTGNGHAVHRSRRLMLRLAPWVLIFLIPVVAAIAPKAIDRHDPLYINLAQRLEPPSRSHWMGTDHLGRDVYSRLVHGTRTTLGVSLAAVAIAVALGTAIGVYSGYTGGWSDLIIQRIVDVMMTFPILVLAMIFVVAFGQSAKTVAVAAGLALTFPILRVIRGVTLGLKTSLFVEAARSYGCSDVRIMFTHLTPHVLSTAITLGTLQLATAILASSSLGFLGLGLPPPAPGWGEMLSGDTRAFAIQNPWLAVFPGLAIALTVLTTNFLADTVRDILDPRVASKTR